MPFTKDSASPLDLHHTVMIEGAKFVTMDDNKLGVGNPVDQANASLSKILSRYQKISIAQNELGIGSDITAEIKELFVQR